MHGWRCRKLAIPPSFRIGIYSLSIFSMKVEGSSKHVDPKPSLPSGVALLAARIPDGGKSLATHSALFQVPLSSEESTSKTVKARFWPLLSRGDKMALPGTDPESYITEYTLVYEDESPSNLSSCSLFARWRERIPDGGKSLATHSALFQIQGHLAHKKTPPPGILQQAYV